MKKTNYKSIKEFAKEKNVSITAVQNWIKDKKIECETIEGYYGRVIDANKYSKISTSKRGRKAFNEVVNKKF